jgi:molybdenum cofactor biosynthesis protein MoaC
LKTTTPPCAFFVILSEAKNDEKLTSANTSIPFACDNSPTESKCHHLKPKTQNLISALPMRDVSRKFSTLRTATAQTSVIASPTTIEQIRNKTVPKGDVLEIARTAALSGVKRCDELIPFCHSVPLDYCDIKYELQTDRVLIAASTKAVYKTGVEIEALLAAQLAAINLYDLLKTLDEKLEIGPTKLLEKKGGHTDYKEIFVPKLKVAILVSSDSTAAGKRKDKSGLIIRDRISQEDCEVVAYDILPDDQKKIAAWLKRQCARKVDLIFTTGGSGLGPRDCTVEATKQVIEKEVPGISEAVRAHGRDRTPYAMLSRAVAGVRGKTLIINLPGSSRGAEESLDALLPGVLHAFNMMRGGGH